MSDKSLEELQPIKVVPKEIIIEEENNHSSIKDQNIKDNYSNENIFEKQRNSKPNDEYQDDYEEQEEYQHDNNANEHIVDNWHEDKPEQKHIEETQYKKEMTMTKSKNTASPQLKIKNEEENEQQYNEGNNEEDDDNYDNNQRNQIEDNEMESILEAEIEDDQKQNKLYSQSNLLIQEDYNQVFDDIIKKNKHNLVFKEDTSNQFKPLTMMRKQDPNDCDANYNNHSNSQKQKCYLHTDKSTASNRPKVPIEFSLYEEAAKRREKIEKVEYNNLMNIILTSSKAKISNNSQKIAISKIEKKIEEVVSKRERNKHLTFIGIGEILTELNIFRDILPKKNDNLSSLPSSSSVTIKKTQTYQSYKEIQKEMINVKENEKRKQSEINFYEQFWLMINPGNKNEIKADMISEILKILFAPINANVKDISELLKQFLMTAFFLNCNPNEVKKYISPITEKDIPEEEIWSPEKVVKEFLLLKENILAYQNLRHFNKNIQNEIIKTEKEITFKPTILGLANNDKGQKWNYYEERLPALVERERLRQRVLEEMKKESEEADLKECTFKPEINKSKGKIWKKESNTQTNTKPNANANSECIYERLYTSNKGKEKKLKQEKEELNKIEETKALAECSFHPKLVSRDSYQHSINNSEYPKGFQEYVTKMQHGIIEAQKKKYNEKRIPRGENYEKVKNANIQPFNITDLQREKKNKKTSNENGKDAFFTIQIKIPSGKERTLKIFINDDPYDVALNFCKTYCFKDEIKERLAKTILSFRTIYMQRNHIEEH